MGLNDEIQRLLQHDAAGRRDADLQNRLANIENQLAQLSNSGSESRGAAQPKGTMDVVCLTCGWHAENIPADGSSLRISHAPAGEHHVLRITRIDD